MDTITLISREGESFTIPAEWARMTWTFNGINGEETHQVSKLLSTHFEDCDDDESLNLMMVSTRNVELFIEFCSMYEEECLTNFTIPINSNDIKELLNQEQFAEYVERVYEEKLDEDGNNKAFFDFIEEVGNYLQSYPIYCLCNYYIASLLYNKGEDEIKSIMENGVDLYKRHSVSEERLAEAMREELSNIEEVNAGAGC